jgi:hypothetical protein
MSLTTALLIVFFVAMIAMHLRGHGGHGGGHRGHGGGCGAHGHGRDDSGAHGHGRDDSSADRTAGEPPQRDHAHV